MSILRAWVRHGWCYDRGQTGEAMTKQIIRVFFILTVAIITIAYLRTMVGIA